MARRKNKAPSAAEVKRLWSAVEPQRWYMLLRELAPENRWSLSGRMIKGRCPFHHDTDPSFVLDFSKGAGRCYGRCEIYVSDIVRLIAKLRTCAYVEALLFIITRFELQDALGQRADELVDYRRVQDAKLHIAQAMRDVLTECLRDQPSRLDYLRPALVYLSQARGIARHLLPQLPLGLYARPEHIKAHLPQAFHDAYDDLFAKYRHPKFWGALCFWYNDAPDSISRFKFRLPAPNAAKVLASHANPDDMPADTARALYSKDFFFAEDPFTSDIGVYGLHHYQRLLGRTGTDAYLTEGEFDTLSVMAGQIAEERPDFVILGAGGKSGVNLAFLRAYGIRTVWVVQDHPARNGNSFAVSLLHGTGNFEGDALNPPLTFKFFEWPPELHGSDLDEAVQYMSYETASRYLHTDRAAHFSNSLTWVLRRSAKAVDAVKEEARTRLMRLDRDSPTAATEEANILDDRKRDVQSLIVEWFRCLHDPGDRLAYTQHYATREGIDIALLSDVHLALYSLDTVEGVKARLKAGLKDLLEFVCYAPDKTGNRFTLWSKRHYETVSLPLNDTGLEQVISLYAGAGLLDWARSLLGQSPVLHSGCSGKDPLADEKRAHANALFLLRQVVLGMTSECRQTGSLKTVGQGIHFGDLPPDARGCVYFVNGAKLFKGRYTSDPAAPVEWEFVNSVVDNGILFHLHPAQKWSAVDDVSDLHAALRVVPSQVFERLRTLLDAWKFRDHDIMRDYLTAWIMSLPVQRAVGQVTITFLTGESTSGKTSFVRGLLGGLDNAGHDVPCILESARFASDATPAWIYQEMDGSSLLLCLDEAETRLDTDHGARIAEIQRMLYSLPTGGVTMTRGGATPDLRASYHLRMPVIMAGIAMNADPVFMTRIMVVRTRKDPLRKNVGDAIADMMSEDDLLRLRREITVGLLPHIPDLVARKSRLYKRLLAVPTACAVTSRFTIGLLTALAVYELAGHDPVPLYQGIIAANRSRLEMMNSHDFQSDVINATLYTEGIRLGQSDGSSRFVSARSLIVGGDYAQLNQAACGVYVLEDRGWIVIVWRQVKFSILSRGVFRGMEETAMKENAAKSAFTIQDVSLEDDAHIRETLRLSDIRGPSGYTILDMAYLMSKDREDHQKNAPAAHAVSAAGPGSDFTL